MIMSMTGYGRCEQAFEQYDITVELRSVNHRYFEFSIRAPRQYAFLEDKLKKLCQARISRGKVDMFLSIVSHDNDGVEVAVNHPLAKGYVDALNEIAETYAIPNGINAAVISRFSDVFTVNRVAVDEDALWADVAQVANTAVDAFIEMRRKEGEKLRDDVLARARTILDYVTEIEAESPNTVAAYRARIEEKMRELLGTAQVDEQRLLTETAIFADKIAVDEETVRLRSHFKQLETMLSSNNAVGRNIDFLIQEMNREANTIGSKSQNVAIAHTVVSIKSEIEKIREQIQNIE